MILVIEDNEADIVMLQMALAQAGESTEIQSITDGAEALDIADKPFDKALVLILLDLNLNNVYGIAVLARLRRNQGLDNIPVIVWSSTRLPRDLESAMALGANDFWLKPATLNRWRDLGERISSLLKLQQKPEPKQLE